MSKERILYNKRWIKDLSGRRFNRLVALEPVGRNKYGRAIWKCQCDCGKFPKVHSGSLLNGNTKSCGCLRKEMSAKLNFKHGQTISGRRTPENEAWHHAIQRCENPNNPKYPDYGGRGISVCERWHKFENFFQDMGKRPQGMSIDRINNDAGYEPGNCRWATPHEQRVNQRPISKGPKKQFWFRAWKLDQMCQFLSNNQSLFVRDHGLCNSSISLCLNGKKELYKGWVFKRC